MHPAIYKVSISDQCSFTLSSQFPATNTGSGYPGKDSQRRIILLAAGLASENWRDYTSTEIASARRAWCEIGEILGYCEGN